jgi:hypothetical protein
MRGASSPFDGPRVAAGGSGEIRPIVPPGQCPQARLNTPWPAGADSLPSPTGPHLRRRGAPMNAFRYLTLAWPGLPWLWLRGSRGGLVLAVAFAVSLDVAVIATFIWPDLVELPITVAVWTGTAVVWLVSTVSALAAFPPPLTAAAPDAVDPLFVKARDAYLARDFITAETRLRALLELAPTDGEAQLLLATLLRRAGRLAEARDALEKLSASDAGIRWRATIAAERSRIAAAARGGKRTEEPDTLPVSDEMTASPPGPAIRSRAA